MKTKDIKTKPSHYELLQKACDKALAVYERAKTNEKTARHYYKTADKDNSKTDHKILKLEYKRAKYRKKARKVAYEIASLRLRQWLKLHESDTKLYQLNETANSEETVQEPVTTATEVVSTTEAVVVDTPSVKEVVEAPKPAKTKSAPKKKTTAPKPDLSAFDLTLIEGIGPKIFEYLKNAGISTFEQLAHSDTDTLKSILKANRNNITNPSTWSAQAQLVLDGKLDDLKAWQVALKGGKLTK